MAIMMPAADEAVLDTVMAPDELAVTDVAESTMRLDQSDCLKWVITSEAVVREMEPGSCMNGCGRVPDGFSP